MHLLLDPGPLFACKKTCTRTAPRILCAHTHTHVTSLKRTWIFHFLTYFTRKYGPLIFNLQLKYGLKCVTFYVYGVYKPRADFHLCINDFLRANSGQNYTLSNQFVLKIKLKGILNCKIATVKLNFRFTFKIQLVCVFLIVSWVETKMKTKTNISDRTYQGQTILVATQKHILMFCSLRQHFFRHRPPPPPHKQKSQSRIFLFRNILSIFLQETFLQRFTQESW